MYICLLRATVLVSRQEGSSSALMFRRCREESEHVIASATFKATIYPLPHRFAFTDHRCLAIKGTSNSLAGSLARESPHWDSFTVLCSPWRRRALEIFSNSTDTVVWRISGNIVALDSFCTSQTGTLLEPL